MFKTDRVHCCVGSSERQVWPDENDAPVQLKLQLINLRTIFVSRLTLTLA